MLLEKLLKDKKITQTVFNESKEKIKKFNKTEEEVILEDKIISEKELFQIKAKILNIELVDSEKPVPREVLEIIPFRVAKNYKIISIKKEKDLLYIGMVYPEDLNAHEFITSILRKNKLSSKIVLISFSAVDKFLKEYKTIEEEVEKELHKIEEEKEKVKIEESVELSVMDTAPVIKIIDVILEQAVEGGASDIHIEPIEKNTRVRFRFLGKLHNSIILPSKLLPSIVSRIKVLSNLKIDETRKPQDGRFSFLINKRMVDFRVSTFPIQDKEKVVLRILDPDKTQIPKIEDLGFLEKEVKKIKEEIRKPYGLILSSGPTGSGKTTTLFAILNELNQEGVNITTMEDPIEYIIDGANQSQMRAEIGYSFATGLRSILRQDPDIIMVGEVRDKETAQLLVNVALTGHLVLSTLHTNDVVGIIPRLIDMGVDPFLIAPVFNVAISQRLIRILCQNCKKKTAMDKEEKKIIMESIESMFDDDLKDKYLNLLNKNPYFYKTAGCSECRQQGYSGRIAVTEILHINAEFTRIISKGPTEEEIKEQTKKQKMITMQQNGMMKVLEGITTLEEVVSQTKKA